MDCNKDEAIKARELAEKKMENNDFEGARKIALKARNLYPGLDNITQLLSICDVHCSAQKRLPGCEKDWYGILQAEKLADELMVKKQYRRLALILHPDKNRFPGAEAAFKLICEANDVLSNPTKKSVYDSKIRVSARSNPACPAPHHINKNSQFNKQFGFQSTFSNNFSTMYQHKAAQPTTSARQDVFWTCCPFCSVRYQYRREHINASLRCPTCFKVFTGYEIGAQGVSLGSKGVQPGQQNVPPKSNLSQTTSFPAKVAPNLSNCKIGVQNDKESAAAYAASERIPCRKTVQSEPCPMAGSGTEGVRAASASTVSAGLKSKEADSHNAYYSHCGREGESVNGGASNRETLDRKNNSRKKARKLVVESSESFDTSSESDVEDVTMKGNFDDATDLDAKPSVVHFPRRSSRKRQYVSYNESDDDDLDTQFKRSETTKDDGNEQIGALGSESSEHDDQDGFPTGVDHSRSESKEMGAGHLEESLQDNHANHDPEDKSRVGTGGMSGIAADTVEIISDSDRDSIPSDNLVEDTYDCPDPEFSDFEKGREESRFDVNQFWACYDSFDGMPRFYAKVKKVCASPFEVSITWLEAVPIDEAYNEWVDQEFPVGCGSYKLGKTERMPGRLAFSHQVHCEKGKKRGSLVIYPRQGEVWALFKDWDISWVSEPENHKKFKYEIVEVLSDFVTGTGVRVCYLDKVTGFVSLFCRAGWSDSFVIGQNELYRFSHCVPSFKMTGSEGEGVPMGSFELDPAALPLNPDDLYYPDKAKTGSGNASPECVQSSQPKAHNKNGKSVISEGTSTPKEFFDLEESDGDV